jgi:hypothetical protein
MTLRDFSRLSETGKDEVVWTKGDFIKDTFVPNYKVALYKINDFYVEVFFDVKEDRPVKYKGCIKSDMLYTSPV